MAGFQRLSQFRPGPTVKLSCMLARPSGSVAAPVSWSWICCLKAMDWLELLVRTVYRWPGDEGAWIGVAGSIRANESRELRHLFM